MVDILIRIGNATINFKGSPQEVSRSIEDFFHKFRNEPELLMKLETISRRSKPKSVREAIQVLVDEHFFEIPREIRDISLELGRRGFNSPVNKISPILLRDFIQKQTPVVRHFDEKKGQYLYSTGPQIRLSNQIS